MRVDKLLIYWVGKKAEKTTPFPLESQFVQLNSPKRWPALPRWLTLSRARPTRRLRSGARHRKLPVLILTPS